MCIRWRGAGKVAGTPENDLPGQGHPSQWECDIQPCFAQASVANMTLTSASPSGPAPPQKGAGPFLVNCLTLFLQFSGIHLERRAEVRPGAYPRLPPER